MSFDALKTPNSPLEKAFEEASKTFSLPSVLPYIPHIATGFKSEFPVRRKLWGS
jgi:hypothetical protein